MTALATQWLWWIFGTFGLVGLIAFWFLAPTAAQLTLQLVVRFFKLLLSYRIGCALLAALVAGLIVDQRRHAYDDQQFAKRTAAFEEAQRQRDAKIEADTKLWVSKRIADDFMAEQEGQHAVDDFKQALPPSNSFRVGADSDRLRALAGLPVRKDKQRMLPTSRPRPAAGH